VFLVPGHLGTKGGGAKKIVLDMNKNLLLLSLAVAMLLCGCEKQAKINSAKLEMLSRNLLLFEQNQASQMAAVQAQLNSLAPTLDKMNDSYFEKNHNQALFFHTNTLYLILMVDNKIEAELQQADAERSAEKALAYDYYTNQMSALALGNAQIQQAMTTRESHLGDVVNAETRRVVAAASEAWLAQIQRLAPDAAEIARRNQLAADVAQIKFELAQMKAQLTNLPAGR